MCVAKALVSILIISKPWYTKCEFLKPYPIDPALLPTLMSGFTW
jgi:hypothetical protein